MKKVVAITGGGTGGHLKIADVFIDEFIKRGFEVVYIGSTSGQDKSWFENDSRIKESIFLETSGVVNKSGLNKVKSLFNMFKKSLFSLKFLYKYNINIVVSVGGFSAAPASFAAILKRDCKFFIHEQNSVIGTLNKKTMKFASAFYSSFHDNSPIKDYPVKSEFFENSRIRKELKTIAFFGGSQGASIINKFAIELAPKLDELGIKIIHQTGKNDFERIQKEYKKLNIEVDVFDFTKDIVKKMNEADFCVSRAGASTLFELCANNLPAFFIPFKLAAKNHQYFNAKSILDKELCFLQTEDELNKDDFFEILKNINLEKMSLGLKNSIKANAIEKIVDDILKY
ncbi:N-acetylglucosamine transferase [Aliarcobacter thereius]|uniref:UDP-N-acetylglucosamine--N-acetylmuramyl-(pentapeptide) pyrophosphoryl-undecaprenol N-acetylglucosamine transferase n=1 Tax=Aliarcobacter thereius TaxID=544718 RepID=A0A5R9H662_9BACT|nr:UDP-N-acetylglucosamine--N-acetylmuramyl-(pentapeptide) pyrophosphoryl-undecaprenol N-acetylglucosamine transferase [Aliarcobacter thereius]OCL85684.1 N-acetylglucosamine transferase [Aliarcobacter thereius]OCL89837.1 N-acetylglucosamine transferase [Aliarcobacter thereius]TLS71582.1 UDP-N-acetylglucosamine--N-acetylmuramyl-(pentapeptide) pyrophosphoryl-undecaprenol N-acetylglucosamine transferase [Aliarcobacter thereius]TLT06220.1 UDP-N-acetylglucosamine--N-acetylmuramyl-(pentapeptide) pyro